MAEKKEQHVQKPKPGKPTPPTKPPVSSPVVVSPPPPVAPPVVIVTPPVVVPPVVVPPVWIPNAQTTIVGVIFGGSPAQSIPGRDFPAQPAWTAGADAETLVLKYFNEIYSKYNIQAIKGFEESTYGVKIYVVGGNGFIFANEGGENDDQEHAWVFAGRYGDDTFLVGCAMAHEIGHNWLGHQLLTTNGTEVYGAVMGEFFIGTSPIDLPKWMVGFTGNILGPGYVQQDDNAILTDRLGLK